MKATQRPDREHSRMPMQVCSPTVVLRLFCLILICAPTAVAQADIWDVVEGVGKEVIRQGADIIRENGSDEPERRQPPREVISSQPPQQQSRQPARPPSYNYNRQKVIKAQALLNRLGYDVGTVDGLYGPSTRRAILAYQTDRGLPRRGDVTAALLARLTREAPPVTSAPASASQEQYQPAHSVPNYNADRQKVARVQALLNRLGYDAGAVDGVYGPSTRSAIITYQAIRGRPLRGDVTAELIARLEQETLSASQAAQPEPPRSPPNYNADRQKVARVQALLKRLGYYMDPPDGRYDPLTRRSIRVYQQSRNLPMNGNVTDELIARLVQEAAPGAADLPATGGADERTSYPAEAAPTIAMVARGRSTAGSPAIAGAALSADSGAAVTGPVGAGLRRVNPVLRDGRLLTGFPITHGRYKASIEFQGRQEKRSHVELARYFDLAILAAAPQLLDEPGMAQAYALRFLTSAAQARFLAPCQYGACNSNPRKTSFIGWVGTDEFQRRESYRSFVAEYRDKLLAMAPRKLADVLIVTQVAFGTYDYKREAFPLDSKRPPSIMASVGTIYGLSLKLNIDLPNSFPVPVEQAPEFIQQFDDRKAYLALWASLGELKPRQSGRGMSIDVVLYKAALFADAQLHKKVHAFGIFPTGSDAVAIAGTARPEAENTGKLHLARGPGGEQMFVITMPEGMKPIRLMALNGLPVTGYPVQKGNALGAGAWRQKHGYVPDIDWRFTRLFDALLVKAQPHVLQGLRFAERFARDNLTQQAHGVYFPPDNNFFRKSFGTNAFERNDLHKKFIATFGPKLTQMVPDLPFEFLYVERVILQPYDAVSHSFGIADGSFGDGVIEQQVAAMHLLPQRFPMSERAARALIARYPGRIHDVYIAYRLAITEIGPNNHIELAPRAIALFEDELLQKLLYKFPPPKQQGMPEKYAGVPLRPHLVQLYAIRDIEGYLTKEELLDSTTRLVRHEQRVWKTIAGRGRIDLSRMCGAGKKVTVFDWSTLKKTKPELASGPLLNVLMDPNADWHFLNNATQFGLVPNHCVAVTIFPRQAIEGRRPEFAAPGLVGTYLASLEAAAARLPAVVYIGRRLGEVSYDTGTGELVFDGGNTGGSRGGTPHLLSPITSVEFVQPGTTRTAKSYRTMFEPKGAEGRAFYRLALSRAAIVSSAKPHPRSLTADPVGDSWRGLLRFITSDEVRPSALAVDRVLLQPRIKMPPARAEALINRIKRAGSSPGVRAMIELKIDSARQPVPGSNATLFAHLVRVVIVDPSGRAIATLPAAAFPDAAAARKQASIAALEQQQAAAARQAAKKRQRETRQATREDNLAKLRACGEQPSGQAELACIKRLCEAWKDRGDFLEFQCKRQRHAVAVRVKAHQAVLSWNVRAQCGSRAEHWGFPSGMKGHKAFVKKCAAQRDRTGAYSVDLLGLRLGMRVAAAAKIRLRELEISQQQRNKHRRGISHPKPFAEASMIFSRDKSDYLALFTAYSRGQPSIGAISRRMYFNEAKLTIDRLVQAMAKKYGQPLWRDKKHLLWSFTLDGKTRPQAAGAACAGVVEHIDEVVWDQGTPRGVDPAAQRGALGLSAAGTPADYLPYADCGVVMVAVLNARPDGTLADVAVVLFEPKWLSQLPPMAFEDPAEKEFKLEF